MRPEGLPTQRWAVTRRHRGGGGRHREMGSGGGEAQAERESQIREDGKPRAGLTEVPREVAAPTPESLPWYRLRGKGNNGTAYQDFWWGNHVPHEKACLT